MECLRSITPLAHLILPSRALGAALGAEPHPQSSAKQRTAFVASPVVQLRENTRSNPGDVGSIPIGRATFDGPMSWVIVKSSLEDERVQIPGHQVTGAIQLAPCPPSIQGRAAVLWLSNW